MTEEEWLRCNHWRPMLDFLGDRITRRQGVLYLCAGLRTIWHLFYANSLRDAVDISERLMDREVDQFILSDACAAAEGTSYGAEFSGRFLREHQDVRDSECVQRLIQMGVYTYDDIEHKEYLGTDAVRNRLENVAQIAYRCIAYDKPLQNQSMLKYLNDEKEWPGAWLVREIFGNPFRPLEMKQEWRTPDVLGLARKAYDERAYDLLPILSDAMEEAGCENFELLIHLRSEGRHVRGCWALDAILGKC